MRIKLATIEEIAAAAANTYPNEFIALLESSKQDGLIDGYVVLPATYGRNFSSVRLDLLPHSKGVVGSVHSHPSPNASPSSADLKVFRATGEIHLIIAYPFNLQSTRAFDGNGNVVRMEVVE